MDAQYWIKKLDLRKHPEGGFFKEVYRASSANKMDVDWSGSKRDVCTSIYFLLSAIDRSVFHKICSDEIWHFYAGSPITVTEIDENGDLIETTIGIGDDIEPQHVVLAHRWFGAEVQDKEGYALVGCTVSPGFDFEDFRMASREQLLSEFPKHKKEIIHFTHSQNQ